MVVTFWGVRGSIPVPGRSTLVYGGNTPCVTIEHEDTLLIIDCGTGFRALGQEIQSLSNGNPIQAHILISHTHWDHIQGFPFFLPAFIPSNTFTIYGARGFSRLLKDTLSGQMKTPYFPVSIDAMVATLDFKTIDDKPFEIDGMTISTCFLNHPGLALGFRISCNDGDVVYFSDHEPHLRQFVTRSESPAGGKPSAEERKKIDRAHQQDDKYLKFCQGAELLIEDAPYTREEYRTRVGWGHACIDDVVSMALKGKVVRLALFHHEPSHSDKQMDDIVDYCRSELLPPDSPLHCFAAREGMQIRIPDVPKNKSRSRFAPSL